MAELRCNTVPPRWAAWDQYIDDDRILSRLLGAYEHAG